MSIQAIESLPTLAKPTLSIRTDEENPNHHLWNNNGTWYIHYTIHPDSLTSERVRRSLGTRDLVTARHRRDQILYDPAKL
jgi:hypothetical protein